MTKAATGADPDGTGIFPTGFVAPTTVNTLNLYVAYGLAQGEPGPDPDEGVDNATWFQYLLAITEGKIPTPSGDDVVEWAVAELDVTNLDEIKQGMIDFDGVILGASLPDDAEQDFEATPPIPWQITSQDQPDPADGHDFLFVDYTPTGGDVDTWGAKQPILLDFLTGEVADGDLDAWVIVTKDDALRVGMTEAQFAALQAECKAWGGTVDPNAPPIPAPPSPPAPTPAPPPPPVPPPVPGPTPPPPGPSPVPPGPPPEPPPAPLHPIWERRALAWWHAAVAWFESITGSS